MASPGAYSSLQPMISLQVQKWPAMNLGIYAKVNLRMMRSKGSVDLYLTTAPIISAGASISRSMDMPNTSKPMEPSGKAYSKKINLSARIKPKLKRTIGGSHLLHNRFNGKTICLIKKIIRVNHDNYTNKIILLYIIILNEYIILLLLYEIYSIS